MRSVWMVRAAASVAYATVMAVAAHTQQPSRPSAGTDWPIFVEKQIPDRLQDALTACGLNAADQQLVASGNTAKLLGIT